MPGTVVIPWYDGYTEDDLRELSQGREVVLQSLFFL